MAPHVFIFIGRSGSGKGTQVKLLQDYLRKTDPERDILYVQSGAEIREFIKGSGFTQQMSKRVYDAGYLQPEFLAVYTWVKVLVDHYKGDQHVIFDGAPRKSHEVGVLDSVFEFYGLGKASVIDIEISEEESMKRLLQRKRTDDNPAEIKKRLAWYKTDVVPSIESYKKSKNYHYFMVDGEKNVEEVHADIMKKWQI